MQHKPDDKAKHIAKCLELAILFEVSADKPGNVNLITGFEGTRYEHFLASAIATAPFFEVAAEKGVAVSQGEIRIADIGLGQIILDCVKSINVWQKGGNTLLGTVILLSPIAAAAGMTSIMRGNIFEINELRKNLQNVIESTTSEDAVNVYEAIKIANPSGLNKAPELDVNNQNSVSRILEENISLYKVFKIAAEYDNVCSEWVNNYPITFNIAYPYLAEQINKYESLNAAIIRTFLKVLSEFPDSFIARKVGVGKAKQVSVRAREILGLEQHDVLAAKEMLKKFDLELRQSDSLLNPGTTADIIAAALGLLVLRGYRP